MNYQAAVTAIAGAHLIKGLPMSWLDGVADDVPVAIWAESGGAGDDIRLELQNGAITEVQVKKGLQAGVKLWDALLSLAHAVKAEEVAYGVLVVSPDSSRSIAYELAADIRHLADGRTDSLRTLGELLHTKLNEAGIPVAATCARLRIRVVHAIESDAIAVAAAKSLLTGLFHKQEAARAVWEILYQDAHALIERRGRWTNRSIRNLLDAAGVGVGTGTSPILVASKICEWEQVTNRNFSILGVKAEVSIDEAWIPLKAVVTDARNLEASDVASALMRYHEKSTRGTQGGKSKTLDAEWIGRFYTRVVVVAGPGMGKSTLLTKLARLYVLDGYLVLKVRLSMVAARMAEGHDFVESVMQLGLSGSGVSPQAAREAGLRDWVLLCDGLDECHVHQEMVAEAIVQFSVGFPHARVVVTTRPIGYHTARFSEWRHYDLLAPEKSAGSTHLANLLRAILPTGNEISSHADEISVNALNKGIGETIAWSPHMLCMAASLLARGGQLGTTKTGLYENLFNLIDSVPNQRTVGVNVSKPILLNVLNTLGWEIATDPLASTNSIQRRCAARLAEALDIHALQAREIVATSVKYWEGIGLIEQLYHGQAALITFIHKTFAEFAAARYLCCDVSDEERASLIEQGIRKEDWSEILGFVGSLGYGQDIVHCFLKDARKVSVTVFRQVLKIVAAPETICEEEPRRDVIAHAWAIVDAEDAEEAYAIGETLADITSVYPGLTETNATSRLSSSRQWVRLVAWLCVVEAGATDYDLKNAIHTLPAVAADIESISGSILGSFALGRRAGGLELIQRFALKIAERLKAEGTEEDIETFLAAIDHSSFDTVGFSRSISQALGTPDRTFKNLAKSVASSLEWIHKFSQPDEYSRAERVAMEVLLGTLAGADRGATARQLNGKIPVQLSAFVALTGFNETVYSDILAWAKPFEMRAAQEVVQSLAKVSVLDYPVLQQEAASVLMLMQESDLDQFWWQIFERADVDVPEPEWSRIRTIGADRDLLLTAVLHKSSWLMICATNLVEGFGPIGEDEAKRLLREAIGHGFAGAAHLVGGIGTRGVELLVDRINGSQVRGLEYVYAKLQEMNAPWSDLMSRGIRLGLVSRHVVVAKRAANLALAFSKLESTVSRDLFEDAYDYWLVNEEPYPQKSGVVPDSPRSTLLEGMCSLGVCQDDRLVTALIDARSDVKEIAVKELASRMRVSAGTGTYVVDKVLDKTITAQGLNALLSRNAAIPRPGIDRLISLLEDNDKKYRRAACGLLDLSYLGAEEIETLAKRMQEDQEHEIREFARRVLKKGKSD